MLSFHTQKYLSSVVKIKMRRRSLIFLFRLILRASILSSFHVDALGPSLNYLCKDPVYEFEGNNESNSKMGKSVSITNDGSLIAIGEPGYDTSRGRVGLLSKPKTIDGSVMNSTVSSWSPNWIVGPSPKIKFGHHTSLSGNGKYMAVGAPLDKSSNDQVSGSIRIYHVPDLSDNFGLPFQTLTGERERIYGWDWFGHRVALSYLGDIFVATAPFSNSGTTALGNAGAVEVYYRSSESDAPFKILGVVYGESRHENLGTDLALADDGTIIAVGSPHAELSDLTYQQGKVSIYEIDVSNGGITIIQTIWGQESIDMYGLVLALSKSAKYLAVTAHGFSGFGGRVIFYKRIDDDSTKERMFVQVGNVLEGGLYKL